MLYLVTKDVTEAVVVMLSVPFALIGGVYLIFILGHNFSVAVWVGFIALYGLAVETGVVMVVYLHEALDRRLLAQSAASAARSPSRHPRGDGRGVRTAAASQADDRRHLASSA